jgi:hydrogenase maturation factor
MLSSDRLGGLLCSQTSIGVDAEVGMYVLVHTSYQIYLTEQAPLSSSAAWPAARCLFG